MGVGLEVTRIVWFFLFIGYADLAGILLLRKPDPLYP